MRGGGWFVEAKERGGKAVRVRQQGSRRFN